MDNLENGTTMHYEHYRDVFDRCPAQRTTKFKQKYCSLQPKGIQLNCEWEAEEMLEVLLTTDTILKVKYFRVCNYVGE